MKYLLILNNVRVELYDHYYYIVNKYDDEVLNSWAAYDVSQVAVERVARCLDKLTEV